MKGVKSLFHSAHNRAWGGSRLCMSLLFFLMVVVAQAQSTKVTGTVIDDIGEPVTGATVVEDGSKGANGVITDLDGNFTINVKPGAKITISFIGYDPVTVVAKDGMTVELKPSSVMLNDVEVVAYGVQKKVTVTGAISSVKGDDLVKTPVSSVNNVLAGQLSGVTTVQYSGEPGADAATVYVRGQGTWNNSAPLIQVDGVERSMSDIDPEEIESITVLKDASATAVFGVRGANGVVLITTKRGTEGTPKIDVSTSFSALSPTKMVEQANAYQYATFHNMMQLNDYEGDMASYTPQFSPEIIEKFRTHSDAIRFPDMQWADYLMKNSTLQTKSNINISGGSKKVRYFISLGLMTQGGLFKEFGYDENFDYSYNRFNYRANLDLDVTSTTTVSFNVSGIVSNDHKPQTSQGASGMILQMYQSTPFYSPGFVDGRMTYAALDYTDGLNLPFLGTNNPLEYLQKGSYGTNMNKMQADLMVNQKLDMITPGLSFRIKGSYNSAFTVNKEINVTRAYYTPVIQPDGSMKYKMYGQDTNPAYTEKSAKARDWYFEAGFNYNRSFGLHSIGGLVLYNQSKTYYPKTYSDIPAGYVGLVGRVTYDYDNRYMAEFNVGYNGSENFHPDHRFGIFPAGSIGWIASNEKFWEPLNNVIDFFKLRASVGLVGNDRVQNNLARFMYLSDPFTFNSSVFGREGYGYQYGIDNRTLTTGAAESAKNNPDVTWEKALKRDYGFDMYFLNSNLSATFDYYKEHRTGILLQDGTAPSYIGFTVPYANLGVVDSWGWEISLNWNHRINDSWRYWANLNISHNQNKVVEMKEAPQNNIYQYSAGHRIGARSMYKFFQFYDSETTPAAYEKAYGKPFPKQLTELKDGDACYVDLDGNGIIDPNDKTRDLGWTDDPQYIAGLNLGVAWKDLELSMQWTGAWGVSRMISDVFRSPFISKTSHSEGGLLSYHLDHTWNPENPGQGYDYPRPSWEAWDNNYAESTLYEKDSKYLRLKTIQLAYNMKMPWMRKVGVRSMQVALSGYNLLTFSPYIWGDPETRASSSPSYPLQKTYTASLKINF